MGRPHFPCGLRGGDPTDPDAGRRTRMAGCYILALPFETGRSGLRNTRMVTSPRISRSKLVSHASQNWCHAVTDPGDYVIFLGTMRPARLATDPPTISSSSTTTTATRAPTPATTFVNSVSNFYGGDHGRSTGCEQGRLPAAYIREGRPRADSCKHLVFSFSFSLRFGCP